MEVSYMYNLNVQTNLGNANCTIQEINYENILSEAGSFINSKKYKCKLEPIDISISTQFFTIECNISNLELDTILKQKGISLDSKKEDVLRLLKSKIHEPILLDFVLKGGKAVQTGPVKFIISKCSKLLDSFVKKQYLNHKKQIKRKIQEISKEAEQKSSDLGIDLKISEIQLS